MTSIARARARHRTLDRALDLDERAGTALWDAVQGNADLVPAGTYGEAVQDTWPVDLAAVLADEGAASYAMSVLLRGYADAFMRDVHEDDASDVIKLVDSEGRKPSELRMAARMGWQAFRDRVKQGEDIVTGLGWDLAASLPHLAKIPDHSSQLALLKRIADLAGRMHKALRGARSKRTLGIAGEYAGVEQGDALRRITSSQAQPLAHDLAEWLVWEAYVRKGLQQHRTAGPAKEGRGPLVVAIDESGSMRGERNVWAKAAAIALVRSANEDNRPAAIVAYSEQVHVSVIKPGDVGAQIDTLLHFFGGGTDTPRALRESADQIDALKRIGHRGADVILVTDGEDPQRDQMSDALDNLAAHGARLWTFGIDIEVDPESPIRARAAKYVPLDRAAMNDPNILTAVVDAL